MEPASTDLKHPNEHVFHTPGLIQKFQTFRVKDQRFPEGKKFTATTPDNRSVRVKVGQFWDETDVSRIYGGTMPTEDGKIKVIIKATHIRDPALQGAKKQLIEREPEIWARLHHPNILPLLGVVKLDDEEDFCLLVSAFENHGNIVRYMTDNPDCDRFQLAYDVASALHYLHHEAKPPVVHGDLKASNVLVSAEARGLLMDFGTTTTVASNPSNKTNWALRSLATERYKSPEEWRDSTDETLQFRHKTPEIDIYCLGGLLYHTLSGAVPWSEYRSQSNIYDAMKEKRRPCYPGEKFKLLPHQRTIDMWLWTLIQWCWEEEPEDRPTTRQVLKYMENRDLYEKWNCPEGLNRAELVKELNGLF